MRAAEGRAPDAWPHARPAEARPARPARDVVAPPRLEDGRRAARARTRILAHPRRVAPSGRRVRHRVGGGELEAAATLGALDRQRDKRPRRVAAPHRRQGEQRACWRDGAQEREGPSRRQVGERRAPPDCHTGRQQQQSDGARARAARERDGGDAAPVDEPAAAAPSARARAVVGRTAQRRVAKKLVEGLEQRGVTREDVYRIGGAQRRSAHGARQGHEPLDEGRRPRHRRHRRALPIAQRCLRPPTHARPAGGAAAPQKVPVIVAILSLVVADGAAAVS
mmetsp:Transcript_30893/g.90474  ORF Transcript_30893/g.90474 Transcript_30893/m.90474 type:complete len:280 (+) Transcript_30893:346-1185(+)